jgi:Family of unknown function (DUF6064)
VHIPFTAEQFFAVFGQYNLAVWPAQALLLALALWAFVLLWSKRPWASVVVSTILALLWVWTALVYHLGFFRAINPLAPVFAAAALVAAALLLWHGVWRRQLVFGIEPNGRCAAGMALVVFALGLYPAWSIADGHGWPTLPTFGLPCPTTIFTLGMLGCLRRPAPRDVFVMPLLWCAVGVQAAWAFGVHADLALAVAGACGLVWMWRAPQTVR